MAKCKQCGREYEGRANSSYCSAACKQTFYRNRMRSATVTDVTDKPVTGLTVTDLEKCRYCGVRLPALQKPRQYPGACYDCAIKQLSKPVQSANKGHTLASRPALEFTGTLTDFERKHYKPASELGPGQHNPVSKPGDTDYVPQCETTRAFIERV